MLVIPALDVRKGRLVRLRQGDFAQETSYDRGPLAQALTYAAAGSRRLHVVDLDAARGSGDNRTLVTEMVAQAGVEVQVAGGIRSAEQARRWLEAGATAVVVGTLAVRRPDLLASLALELPGRVLAALDVRAGRPVTQGWLAVEEQSLEALLERWSEAPLAGVVLTSVERDGTLAGPDLELLARVRGLCPHPVTYSGGVASLDQLRALQAAGADGVLLGKALLEGHLDLAAALAALS